MLDLDRKIRDYEIPQNLKCDGPPIEELNNTNLPVYVLRMQRFHAKQWKDTAILHLHRAFYSQVLNEAKARQSPTPSPIDGSETGANNFVEWSSVLCDHHAPSVLATFISACKIIVDLEQLYQTAPDICPHYAVFWFNAFCGGVSSSMLLLLSPLDHKFRRLHCALLCPAFRPLR